MRHLGGKCVGHVGGACVCDKLVGTASPRWVSGPDMLMGSACDMLV